MRRTQGQGGRLFVPQGGGEVLEQWVVVRSAFIGQDTRLLKETGKSRRSVGSAGLTHQRPGLVRPNVVVVGPLLLCGEGRSS